MTERQVGAIRAARAIVKRCHGQVLARGSFTSPDDLAAKIDAYVRWYLKSDRPFRWSYRPKSWRMDGQTSGGRY